MEGFVWKMVKNSSKKLIALLNIIDIFDLKWALKCVCNKNSKICFRYFVDTPGLFHANLWEDWDKK